jgi:Fe-S-cluster containining protein
MLNPCSSCSAECCSNYIITVTSFDVLRAAEASLKKPEEFATLHEPRLLGYDPDLVLETTDGYGHYLLGFKSHPCFFLKKRLCTIHENAPLSCRHYPHTVAGTMNARFCPLLPSLIFRLKGPETDKDKLIQELDAYKNIVKEWNEKKGERKDCISFLLNSTKPLLDDSIEL